MTSGGTPSVTAGNGNGARLRGSFAIMTLLFFMWGFMFALNDILIPRFKETFTLSYFQAMLVQFAFFAAYFTGSLLYFVISATTGDPIARIGYRRSIVFGLGIAGTGAGIFWPAAVASSYPMFLAGLFILGLGLAVLQIAANPYVTILGSEETASSRLNLAQGFNSVGAMLGPLVGGWLIFHTFNRAGAHGADSVKVPYLAFSAVLFLLAGIFLFVHLPRIGEGKIERGAGALRHPHVVLGVIAIFMYVGGEVSVCSAIINFLGQKSVAGLTPAEASQYVALFYGGLLIGRFVGAVELGEMAPRSKQLWRAAIPLAGFLALWALRGWDVARNYVPFLVLCWALFRFGRSQTARTLMLFAASIVLLLLTAMLFGGKPAMWCIVAIGLFTSICWSNTFSLALEGTGALKSQVSSLLVMAVLGGAILPPIQGAIADAWGGLRYSFIVPLIAYAYVAFYGALGHRVGRRTEASFSA